MFSFTSVFALFPILTSFACVVSESTEATEEAEPTEPEGPKEMTLDEWKALQKGKDQESKSKSSFNIRKAGEGVDDGQWKKTYVLSKKKDANSDEDDEEESDEVSSNLMAVVFPFKCVICRVAKACLFRSSF